MSTGPATGPAANSPAKKTTAVGPRDGKKAFERITSILGKLDQDVLVKTLKAVNDWGTLQDDLAEGKLPAAS